MGPKWTQVGTQVGPKLGPKLDPSGTQVSKRQLGTSVCIPFGAALHKQLLVNLCVQCRLAFGPTVVQFLSNVGRHSGGFLCMQIRLAPYSKDRAGLLVEFRCRISHVSAMLHLCSRVCYTRNITLTKTTIWVHTWVHILRAGMQPM